MSILESSRQNGLVPIILTQSFLNIQISFAELSRIKFKAVTRSVLRLRIVRGKSEIPRASFAGVYPVQNMCSIKFHIHRVPPVFVVVCIGLSPRGGPDITRGPPARISRSWNIYDAEK